GAVGVEEGLELDGVAGDVPVGVVGVLGFLAGAGEGVDLVVEADVLTVLVAEEGGRKQGVIETGGEDGALGGCAAFDGDAVEKGGPDGAGLQADSLEVPAGNLLVEICLGALLADKRDADFEEDFAFGAEVEPCSGVLAVGGDGGGVGCVVLPDGGGFPGLVEAAGNVEGVM